MSDQRFQDLGLDFPLFGAPIRDCSSYHGLGTCAACGQAGHCFRAGIGADIDLECSGCGTTNCLHGHDAGQGKCRCSNCGERLVIEIDQYRSPIVCYDCIRAGRTTLTKGTEFGMVRREDALKGRTHGRPKGGSRFPPSPFETIPHTEDPDSGWEHYLIPEPLLHELIRTPDYHTIQGDNWLFHCEEPMIYMGRKQIADIRRMAPNGDVVEYARELGGPYFTQVFQPDFAVGAEIYLFSCTKCDAQRVHWDIDA